MRGNLSIARGLGCASSVLAALALAACAPKASTPAAATPGETRTSAPPSGTAPPAIQYEAHVSAGGLPPPGGPLSNPHQGDPAVAKAGSLLFTALNCDGCHGVEGAGWVGPNLGDGRWRYGGADNEIFTSIFYGRPKGMPAFGGALGPEGVWSLVTYLKSLPVPADEATESWEKP